MIGIYQFDGAALMIIIALFVAALSKRMYKNKSSKVYMILLVAMTITTICDAISCFSPMLNYSALMFFTTLYHLFRNSLLVIYLIYVISLCELERRLKRKKWLIILFLIPFLFVVTIILLNLYNHGFFYYDYVDNMGNISEDLYYHRGPWILAAYINSVFYFLVTIFIIIRYRFMFNLREKITIFAIFPITIISLIIQFLYQGLLIESFSSALSAIIISIAIEIPIEYNNSKFNIGNTKAFAKEMKKYFLFKKKESCQIIAKIKNYYEIYDLYTYDIAISYVKNVIKNLSQRFKLIDNAVSWFYLDNGIFAIVLSEIGYEDKILDELKDSTDKLKKNGGKYSPNPQFVLVNACQDFKDYNEYLIFIKNYSERLSLDGNIIRLSKIKEDKTFKIISNIDSIIDEAIKNNQLLVYYQPIYNVKSDKYYSAEALVRLNHPEYGLIPPGIFIPQAEKTGKIIQIDNYVFESICKFIASDDFKKSGLKYIEFNISMIDCVSPYLYSNIIYTMEKYGVTPDKINIEITESYDSLNEKVAKENIKKLKDYGISFSLDDYGTGYSNIERFSILPITNVKIDKSLVDSSTDDKMRIVLKNTFNLIKSLERETIIEGIETEEQSKRFIDFDCDNIQGYYYSRPLPYDEFIKFIFEKNKVGESV